jgi:malate synthase
VILPAGVELRGPLLPGFERVLTGEALELLADLARRFGPRVGALLAARRERQERFDAGQLPDFLPETRDIRESSWAISPLPADLLDRRVEITGPVDRKMVINALNSGASVFMADFEDATCPTWANLLQGHINLSDAIRRTITFEQGERSYRLNDRVATLMMRPRGWHLFENNLLVDGLPIPGGIFDLSLYVLHNARALQERGSGPYCYLPKLEGHLEARLWNEVLTYLEEKLALGAWTIRATVLIETLPAAFEMDEILYELRTHSAGLNCGRWDYIFSYIKKFRADATRVLPDRGQVTMDRAFLRAYSLLLIRTCHRRGAPAMGGMAAQIPIKSDPAANEAAMAKVRADKLREVQDGHDGTWVAHPALVPLALEIFNVHMKTPNQIDRKRDDITVTAADLIKVHDGTRSIEGLRHNVRVGVQYIEAWLRGQGCVPLYNLMEDAATAEISRAQVWQWLHHRALLIDGTPVTPELFAEVLREEMHRVHGEVGEARYQEGRFPEAIALFERLATAPTFEEFLTVPAYAMLA